MKTALIIAFHFPPNSVGSGFLRILKFCRFLPQFGWRTVVLTASSTAYERIDSTLLEQIPKDVPVVRAFALDARKHLSFRGRYSRWTALPDRWASWAFVSIISGVFQIRLRRPDVIISTYPIATAVLIGFVLHKLTGKPWVVDFRDSMTEDNYPSDPLTRRIYRWLEYQAVQHASLLAFTTPSTIAMYRSRYPQLPAEKCLLIPNGYDEEDFQAFVPRPKAPVPKDRPVILLHLGVIYPHERDPRPFFRAISRLKKLGRLSPATVQVNLRASGTESYYAAILKDLDIADLVHLLPAVPYPQALHEAQASDALLLFQAANCNHQIPAKAYEYARLGKPILGLTPEQGDTADLLFETGGATVVDLADEEAILRVLPDFLNRVRNGEHATADLQRVQRYTRENQSKALAASLTQLTLADRSGLAPKPTVDPVVKDSTA